MLVEHPLAYRAIHMLRSVLLSDYRQASVRPRLIVIRTVSH
jgi:hypothetical protein